VTLRQRIEQVLNARLSMCDPTSTTFSGSYPEILDALVSAVPDDSQALREAFVAGAHIEGCCDPAWEDWVRRESTRLYPSAPQPPAPAKTEQAFRMLLSPSQGYPDYKREKASMDPAPVWRCEGCGWETNDALVTCLVASGQGLRHWTGIKWCGPFVCKPKEE
jgi:hypothetical protein